MDTAEAAEQRTDTPEGLAAAATAPARWLLETASDGGVPLTQTFALARVVVREAAERWHGWWNAELFGVPHREADMALLGELREGLLRKRLVRRRGSKLLATAKGRKLVSDPIALLYELALDLGGGDPFTVMVALLLAAGVALKVSAVPEVTEDEVVQVAALQVSVPLPPELATVETVSV